MNIYVASSWRNERQQEVVKQLREAGHYVYDFKNPSPLNTGFSWSEVDPNWKEWDNQRYMSALNHPVAEKGFQSDFLAMQWADVCVLVLPCGRSAHTEAGWMAGDGKYTIVLLPEQPEEPELMYKIYNAVTAEMSGVLEVLKKIESRKQDIYHEKV